MSTITVRSSGGNYNLTQLQNAINAAAEGDSIVIESGATCTGSFSLPNKGALTNYITITSDATLPPAGQRIISSTGLAKIVSDGGGNPTMYMASGANHYRLLGLAFPPTPLGYNQILCIGMHDADEVTRADMVDFIEVDRCYFYRDAVYGQKRGILINAKNATIKNCHIEAGTPDIGADGQCIAGWNGAGPYTIDNNELLGGTESWIIGGADPNCKILMNIGSSPTTTSCTVTVTNSPHTLSELAVGDLVAFDSNSGTAQVYGTLTNISGSGTTGTLTYTTLSTTPDVGVARAGVVLGDRLSRGFTFTRNWVHVPLTERTVPIISPATSPVATPATTGGTLAAGTYYYKVVAYNTGGNEGATIYAVPTSEVSATVSGTTSKITISWTASATATNYRVYRGATAGNEDRYTASAASPFVDTGAAMTVASIPAENYWRHKNLGELKAAQHCVIRGNIFEGHFDTAVGAYNSTWWKSTNQDNNGTFCQTKDVVVERNIFRHVRGWVTLHAQESYASPSGSRHPPPMTDITFRDNLIYDSGLGYGADVWAVAASGASVRLSVYHNTIVHLTTGGGGGSIVLQSGEADPVHKTLVVRDNLCRKETYGLWGDTAGEGTVALTTYASSYTVTKNAIEQINTDNYPAGNFGPTDAAWKAEFENYVADGTDADFRLKPTSTYHRSGTDSKDLGCDIAAVLEATTGVLAGYIELLVADTRQKRNLFKYTRLRSR